jgi:Domain of unknown function (DUF222)
VGVASWEGMVAVNGLLDPEGGQTLLAALEPLARPTNADDDRSGAQRRADALAELARRQLEGGRLPQTGGVRPQLLVTVDLHSLLGPGGLGGEAGGGWPLDPETCRRLACDGAVTRVLVTRQPPGHHDPGHDDPGDGRLAAQLQAAATLLPATLGGSPTQPLEVGRTSRVVSAAQRAALVVRDRGCAVAGCDRPPPWCEHPMWEKSRTSLMGGWAWEVGSTAAGPVEWPGWGSVGAVGGALARLPGSA